MTAQPREGFVQVRRRCPHCAGEGLIDFAHCNVCGQAVSGDDPWWEADEALLPCGHEAARHLAYVARCPQCEGQGEILEALSDSEYRSRKRSRLLRGAFLLLLGMIPFALLAVAIMTAEPPNVCGSWWYGVVLLSLGILVQGPTSEKSSLKND